MNVIERYFTVLPGHKCLEICFSDMKCNMNCEYCYGDHKTREFHNSLSLNKEILAEELKKINEPLEAAHLWGGELLFNKKEFIEVVALVREYFPDLPINVMTNGLLLPEWTDFIIKNKIHIGISHDGPGQKYRGYNFLESSKHNDAIKALYDAGLFRKFKSVLHCKNYSIENIINYFLEYSDKIGRKVGNDQLIISPNKGKNSLIFRTSQDMANLVKSAEWSTINIIKHLKEPSYLDRFYQAVNVYQVLNILEQVIGKFHNKKPAICSGLDSISFSANGKRIPCHCFSERVLVEDDIRVDHSYMFKKCGSCKFISVCGGGCSAQTNEELDLYCTYAYCYYNTIFNTIETLNKEFNLEKIYDEYTK